MRRKRVKVEGGGYYHLMSRCALKQFLLGEDDKRAFVSMLHRIAAFSGIEVLTYCVMSNHFHVLVHVPRSEAPDEEELLTRVAFLYGHERSNDMRQRWHGYRNAKLDAALIKEQSQLRKRMGDISPFMQILKQRFTIWYRAHHEGHEGTLWQGRFSSTLVEGGGSLAAVAAYIDLNPVRAGLVADPKDYRFSGFGAATSGDKQASQGLTGIYGNTTNDTAKVMAVYRGLLYAKGGGAPPPLRQAERPVEQTNNAAPHASSLSHPGNDERTCHRLASLHRQHLLHPPLRLQRTTSECCTRQASLPRLGRHPAVLRPPPPQESNHPFSLTSCRKECEFSWKATKGQAI